jgi:lipopolysaccharide-induced tumor necrosis factor-alpha factor
LESITHKTNSTNEKGQRVNKKNRNYSSPWKLRHRLSAHRRQMNSYNPNGQQPSSSCDVEQGKLPETEKPLSQAPNYADPQMVIGTAPSTAMNQFHASAPPAALSSSAPSPLNSNSTRTTPPPQFYASAPPKIPTVKVVGTPIPPASATVQKTTIPEQSVKQSIPTPNVEINARHPIRLDACPYCNTKNMKTKTVTSPNLVTCIAVLIILLLFWPLFWIPLCMNQCMNTKHFCSECERELDEIEPLSDCCVKRRG